MFLYNDYMLLASLTSEHRRNVSHFKTLITEVNLSTPVIRNLQSDQRKEGEASTTSVSAYYSC